MTYRGHLGLLEGLCSFNPRSSRLGCPFINLITSASEAPSPLSVLCYNSLEHGVAGLRGYVLPRVPGTQAQELSKPGTCTEPGSELWEQKIKLELYQQWI